MHMHGQFYTICRTWRTIILGEGVLANKCHFLGNFLPLCYTWPGAFLVNTFLVKIHGSASDD
jgi:hypothetical protein